jgi:hypothetical protein
VSNAATRSFLEDVFKREDLLAWNCGGLDHTALGEGTREFTTDGTEVEGGGLLDVLVRPKNPNK